MPRTLLFIILFLTAFATFADSPSIPLITTSNAANGTTYSINVKILLFMTVLTFIPALLITMTSFTRIIIVFSILRQAIGIPNVPSNQILIGLALIMTFYVMMPVFSSINEVSLQPYLQGKINEETALNKASGLTRKFMLKQTRKADLNMFVKLSKSSIKSEQYPFYIILPAFITSELKTAFQIGFLIFLPFLIIDLVTSSVLMSMGMMMLSPMIISLPFKILFFVMLNGWSLMVTSLVNSFRV